MGLGAIMPNHIPTLLHTPLCENFDFIFSNLTNLLVPPPPPDMADPPDSELKSSHLYIVTLVFPSLNFGCFKF